MKAAASRCGALLVLAMLIAACGQPATEKKSAGPPPTLITTARAASGPVEVSERTLGSLESPIDPKVGAEVAGRVLRVHARAGSIVKQGELLAEIDATDAAIQSRGDEADVKRIAALLAQAERLAARQAELVGRGFISRNALDDASAQRDALREQLAMAKARAEAGRRSVAKTRVLAPLDAQVEVQLVSPGDYVKVGDPLFQLIAVGRLRAHLPFPELVAGRIRAGQTVRLTAPQSGARELRGVVSSLRPSLIDGSRSVDVLVDIDNDGSLRGGGSVDAEVILASRRDAVLVPEQSVVLRPAGTVVYVIADKRAKQRPVTTGSRREGLVEVLTGLSGGETLALDGAGFLTDGAAVSVKAPAAAKPATP